MRVLVVTITHPPVDARIYHRQIGALVEAGHDVTYAAPFTAFGQSPPNLLRTVNLPRSSGNILRRIPAILAAARLIRHERTRQDLILVHDPELLAALALAQPNPNRGPVLVWDVHEDVPAQAAMLRLPSGIQLMISRILRGVELIAERRVRLLLAEAGYRDNFREGHPVVPNSVRVPPGDRMPAETTPRVIYVGALTWARGARELITVAGQIPEAKFEIIGNAPPDVAAALTEAASASNIDYRGFVPNDQALTRLPGALVGLSLLHDQPNYAHSQPTKVMEYMAHGLPTVTTPNPASAQLVRTTDAGIVVPFGDVPAMVEAIRQLMADLPERDRLAANAHAAAREHDWNVDGPAFSALLEQWVRGRD
ncbi:MAG: glycosyltransferase [Propioniciclava sp.]